jgi:hypothetical protein
VHVCGNAARNPSLAPDFVVYADSSNSCLRRFYASRDDTHANHVFAILVQIGPSWDGAKTTSPLGFQVRVSVHAYDTASRRRRPMHIESMEAQLVPPMGFIFERVTYKWKNFVSVAPNNARLDASKFDVVLTGLSGLPNLVEHLCQGAEVSTAN